MKVLKRLIILSAVLVGVGLLLYLIQRYQLARMNQSVLSRAAEAEKNGDFENAARLYQEHLVIADDDLEAKERLADVLTKTGKNPALQDQAIFLYGQILTRKPGNTAVRRKRAELMIERQLYQQAREDLEALVSVEKNDGSLQFLLGRCREELGMTDRAAEAYQAAIDNDAAGSQRLESYRRLADLKRGPLNDPAGAEAVIKQMIASQPDNPQVYLESGRYHRKAGDRVQAKADFERVLKQAPKTAEAYPELARLAVSPEEARRILEAGIKALPQEPMLYLALADVEFQAGAQEKGLAVLRDAIERMPDQPNLRFVLANALADRGETTSLGLQIEELKRLHFARPFLELLEARLQVNSKDWSRARQTLVRLQPILDQDPAYKALINSLLARCYRELGDPVRQRSAVEAAAEARPDLLQTQLERAESLAQGGDLDRAIEVYRELVDKAPQLWSRLAQLLIARGQLRPASSQIDWSQAESLIAEAAKRDPQSSDPALLNAELAAAQGHVAEALGRLDAELKRTPEAVAVWLRAAALLRSQRQFERARERLARAEELAQKRLQEVGSKLAKATEDEANRLRAQADRAGALLAEARLEAARLLIAEGGAGTTEGLRRLLKDSDSLPRAAQIRFVESLAQESSALQDTKLARECWSKAGELDRRKLEPRIELLELAFREVDRSNAETHKAIQSQLDAIRAIDGVDGPMSRYQDCLYLLWQADDPKADPTKKARLRTAARNVLDELGARRSDWPLIPLRLGLLAETESRELEAADKEKNREAIRAKRQEAASNYLRAVQLGNRDLAVVGAYRLFQELGDKEGEDRLVSLLPASVAVKSLLGLQAAGAAVRAREFSKAVELATQAVKDAPGNRRARIWLATLLAAQGQLAESERTLREGDPKRVDGELQVALVRFLALSRQLEKAEEAVRSAEASLKDPQRLAQCCELIGFTYRATRADERRAKEWFDRASEWYAKAKQERPDDTELARSLIEFRIRTGDLDQAKDALTKILQTQGTEGSQADEVAWARRTLATVLLSSGDFEPRQQALSLVKPLEDEARQGRARAEDLRVLARVYEAQNTREYHQQARRILEDLAARADHVPDDLFYLAAIYSADQEWARSQEFFDRLVAETEESGDIQNQGKRREYLSAYLREILKRHESKPDPALLSKAEEILAKYKQSDPDGLGALALEARLLKAQGQLEKAAQLLERPAKESNLAPAVVQALAKQAEDLGFNALAEQMLEANLKRADTPQNRLALALYHGRHGAAKKGLDLCEPLWNAADERTREQLINPILLVLFGTRGRPDRAQVDRAAGWVEKALNQQPKSGLLLRTLGSLREQQNRIAEAEELYRRALAEDSADVMALNNLAWLLALRNERSGTALELIERAIGKRGPLPELLDTRGVIRLVAGDSPQAIDDLTRATERDPSGPKFFHLAQAYLHANQREKAIEALTRAREQGLAETDLHHLETQAYRKLLADLGAR